VGYAYNDGSSNLSKVRSYFTRYDNKYVIPITSSDSPYTFSRFSSSKTDDTLLVDTTSGTVTVNLPPAALSEGRQIIIKKTNSEPTLITIDANASELIDGETTLVLWAPYDVVDLVCTGTGWNVLNRDKSRRCVASCSLDGTSVDPKSGTYSRTDTTVTVSVTGHGMRVGDKVYFDATSGTAADGIYDVATVAGADEFTFTHAASGATNGNVSLRFITLPSNAFNIHSIVKWLANDGIMWVNFTNRMPDALYAVTTDSSATASVVAPTDVAGGEARNAAASAFSVYGFKIRTANNNDSNANHNLINFAVFR
jgi:hypothetical protein